MKIAYLTNQYPHQRHTFIRREIRALEALGLSIERYSIRDSGADCVDPQDQEERSKTDALLSEGLGRLILAWFCTAMTRPIRFCRAWIKAIQFGRRAGAILKHQIYLAEACILQKRLQQKQIQHLHIHFATNPATVAMLCEILGGPTWSLTIHGPEEWDRPEALSLREKYHAAKLIIAVSDYGRCQVYRWCDRNHWNKVHVIHCGVDDLFLSMEPTPVPETNQLISVAALSEQKGHLFLLRALEKVKQLGIDFKLLLVGDGPLRQTIEMEIQQRGLTQQIQLLGWQSNQRVRELLLQSRALIMPSFAENLPVAMMEAFALGRPILGTYIAGVPELIESDQSGWVVPAGNIDLTANAIQSILMTSTQKLTEMGQAGRKKVLQSHQVRIEAEKLKQLFLQ